MHIVSVDDINAFCSLGQFGLSVLCMQALPVMVRTVFNVLLLLPVEIAGSETHP